MAESSTRHRPSSPRCASDRRRGGVDAAAGSTLTEVLVALLIGSTVVAGAVVLAFGSEDLFRSNQRRTDVNQALRAGLDVLGNELRETGLLLPEDFVAIELVDGPFQTPDELVIRKSLHSVVMPICADVSAGASRNAVSIADTGGTPPAGCAPVPDGNADTWPDNLEAWRAYRIADGGTVRVYAYNPLTRLGEFFDVVGEDNVAHELDTSSGTWTNSYTVASGSRVYILYEQRLRLTGDLVESVINADTSTPLGLTDRIDDLQFRVILADGTILNSFGTSDEWADVETIEITLVGSSTLRGVSTERRLVGRFNPRNVLSL